MHFCRVGHVVNTLHRVSLTVSVGMIEQGYTDTIGKHSREHVVAG